MVLDNFVFLLSSIFHGYAGRLDICDVTAMTLVSAYCPFPKRVRKSDVISNTALPSATSRE